MLLGSRQFCVPSRRPIALLATLALGVFAWGVAAGIAGAQPLSTDARAEEGVDRPPLRAAENSTLPGEVKPEVYLLRDKNGRLQSLLGFSFETFSELFKLKNRLEGQEQKPRYTLERAALVGKADGGRARLTAEFAVVVRESGWVKVPLRLTGAMLTATPSSEGTGRHFVQFENDGYVAWIDSQPDTTHKLRLEMLVPVASIGNEKQLKLTLPRATVSEMKLEVGTAGLVGRVSDESTLVSAPSADGKTTFTVAGLGGAFELAWRPTDAPVARIPTTLEASGAILVEVDAQRVRSEAVLSVRSLGGLFNHFRVRLPRGAELVRGDAPPGAVVTLVAEPQAKPGDPKLLEVKLDKETAGPVEIPIVAERPFRSGDMQQPFDLAGFEVLGAVRQYGHVAVQPGGNWQILWGERHNVRQVDELPEALRRDGVVAGFEYFVQPFVLQARITSQSTHVQVAPSYVFRVQPRRVSLEATLHYTIRGAKTRALPIRMPRWHIDRVGPSNLVHRDLPLSQNDEGYEIALAQETSGQFDITLEAHRPLDDAAGRIDLELPVPKAETVDTAELTVLAANNIELDPRPDGMVGLTLQSVQAPANALAANDQFQEDALFYRAEGLPAIFSADFEHRRQAISVAVDSNVELTARELRVQQRMTFQVSYETVSALAIDIPPGLSEDQLTILLDGRKITAVSHAERSGDDAGKPLRMRVPLARPKLGRFELETAFAVPREPLMPAASVPVKVPLVMPATGKVTRNAATVSSEAPVSLGPLGGTWTPAIDNAIPGGNARRLQLSSTAPAAELSLIVRLGDRQPGGLTIVDRGLVQTFLTATARQERATYHFSTGDSALKLTVPGDVDRASVSVTLDGAPVRAVVDNRGTLTVPLEGSAAIQHLLVVKYRCPPLAATGRMELSSIELPRSAWVERLYWQLNLPENQHLVVSPQNFNDESRWVWQRFYWARRPALSYRELTGWVGLPGEITTSSGNQYLFSTIEPRAVLECWTARRSLLVFGASLLLLVAGWVLIYVPAARHPAALLLLAMGVVAATAVDPDTALLFAQAASLGMLMLLVALLLARRTRPAPLVIAPMQSSSQGRYDRSRTQLYYRRATGGETTTATAPIAMQVSGPESEA